MKKQQEKMILVMNLSVGCQVLSIWVLTLRDLDIIKCPSKPPKPQKDDMEV
jgi:hypothetical protein